MFTLSKQLLSTQQHYDWGLRALKAVLNTGGKLIQVRQANSYRSVQPFQAQVGQDDSVKFAGNPYRERNSQLSVARGSALREDTVKYASQAKISSVPCCLLEEVVCIVIEGRTQNQAMSAPENLRSSPQRRNGTYDESKIGSGMVSFHPVP